jgi:hypothetical protein
MTENIESCLDGSLTGPPVVGGVLLGMEVAGVNGYPCVIDLVLSENSGGVRNLSVRRSRTLKLLFFNNFRISSY